MRTSLLAGLCLFALVPSVRAQSYGAYGEHDHGRALAEVNAARAQRGLPPYMLDEGLARGATACAIYRARHGMDGHTPNDFGFLPAGSQARSAGCAAWPVGMGWGSCCTFDNYQYAGAGYCVGTDGKRYMHLFVR